jgi:hypothetical protein
MKKNYYKQKENETVVISCIAKKVRDSDIYLGNFIYQGTIEQYTQRKSSNPVTWFNVYLGTDKNYLDIEANKFVDSILPLIGKKVKLFS